MNIYPETVSSSSPKRETFRFALLQFFFWSAIVNFEAFMVPWLRSHHYSPSQAGLIMALVPSFAIFGQPIMGSISDTLSSPGRLVAIALSVGTIVFCTFPLVVDHYLLLLVWSALYSITIASLPAILDAWILARRDIVSGVNYGEARASGSFGFAVLGIFLGYIVDVTGLPVMFVAFGVSGAAAVATALAITRRTRPTEQPAPHAHHITPSPLAPPAVTGGDHLLAGLRVAFTNRAYVTLLIGALLAFSGLRAALTFLPYLFESVGGSVGQVSIAHSIGALSEVPFFLGAAFLHRWIRGPKLISITLGIMTLRIMAYPWMATPEAILSLQITHGLTFGVFTAAAVDYISEIAPKEHRGFLMALAPSVYFGFGSIFGSYLGGLLFEATSIETLYRTAAAVAAIGIPLPLFGCSSPSHR